MMRLSVEANRRAEGVAVGSPGIDSCRWLKPVRSGDTLAATTEVLETWPSRSKPFGFVRRRVDVTNQRSETVMALVGISMYARRDPTVLTGGSRGGSRPAATPVPGRDQAAGARERPPEARPAPATGASPARAGSAAAGLYFEDVRVGDTMRFGRYAVTKEEIVEFARQFDPQPFHLDEVAARRSLFGGLVASGWHTGAMFIRMVCDHMAPRLRTWGALGFDDLRWLRPVRPGDVLSVESVVGAKRESQSRRDRGTVEIASRVLNQAGEPVMSLVSLVISQRRPDAAGPAGA
jgi:acyl dehydratase